jgi:hypothetical protein
MRRPTALVLPLAFVAVVVAAAPAAATTVTPMTRSALGTS